MTTKVLLTHHHHQALANAAERGFWMPLPLQHSQLAGVLYLTALSRGETTIKQLVEVASFEPWRHPSGVEHWLAFLGQRIVLPRPIPLGNRRYLTGWLPGRREESVILPLDGLLAAERLSDLLSVERPCCPWPRRQTGTQGPQILHPWRSDQAA